MKSENKIKNDLMVKLMPRRDIRIFRNNVGMAYQGKTNIDYKRRIMTIENFRTITYGLVHGSGDFIGWKEMIIDESMIGQNVAVFLSIETKTPTGTREKNQINWCKKVNNSGGIAVFVDDLENILI